MKQFLSFILLFTTVVFCSEYSKNVKQSLIFANKNKKELKKVLEHYNRNPSDSLKYKAACFLIENMQWHSGKKVIPPEDLWQLFLLEDSLVKPMMRNPLYLKNDKALNGYKYGAKKILIDNAVGRSFLNKENQSDLLTLDAEFIIETIETAFKVKELDWCKHLAFDDFCEFILPYRFNNEPVYPIRKNLYEHFIRFYNIDSLNHDPYKTIGVINRYTNLFNWDWDENPPMPDLGFYNIFYWQNTTMMTCTQQIAIQGQIMRSIGLPVIEVFTPKWRDMNLGHSWCAILDSTGKLTLFTAFYQIPGDEYKSHKPQMGTKLYMKTFAAQPHSPYYLKSKNEKLPSPFDTPCIKDITAQIVDTKDIEIEFTTKPPENNLCWFSIFIQGNWEPVGWGIIDHKGNKLHFKDIPVGLTGLACYYDQNKLVPCSRFFTVTKNGLEYIDPSGTNTTLHIIRKYPEKTRLQYFVQEIIGTEIQGANNPEFSEAHTLGKINETLRPYMQDISFPNQNKYRYYRLQCPNWHLYMAELEFLSNTRIPNGQPATPLPVFEKNKKPLQIYYKFPGKILADKPDSTAFDGNILTYDINKWIGLDLGSPQCVNRIRLAPRNANNNIVVGNNYQLFYWDNSWISAGTQKAKYNFVEFEDVPANTLYWLRNLVHGKEEQPFFYINGKQVFSNQ